METVQKVMYLTITGAVIVITSIIIVVAATALATINEHQPEPLDPDKTLDGIRSNAAYLTIYERYPDAIERINHNDYQLDIEIGVMNSTSGNQLIMRIYAHSEHDYNVNARCVDNAGDTFQHADSLFVNEFIRTTDCVE